MTKLKLFGAAAVVLSSALAGPAMAQQVVSHPGRCVQYDPGGNCQRYAAAIRGDCTPRLIATSTETTTTTGTTWNNGNWNNGWRDSRNDNRWQRRIPASGLATSQPTGRGRAVPVGTAGASDRAVAGFLCLRQHGGYNNG